MILHPAIVALFVCSAFVSLMVLHAAYCAGMILRRWDLTSGSELQLSLERRTYLVSTLLGYALTFQLASFFLFIYTADSICTMFIGAMCAAGTLHANGFGYPTLSLKILNFLLAGTWLLVNHVDNKGFDAPLVRVKYALFLGMVPFLLGEAVLQALFFAGLKPALITSCCGSLFGTSGGGLASEMAALPVAPTRLAFFGTMGAVLATGFFYWRKGRGGLLFSLLSVVAFVVGAASLVSFLSIYFYELPTHHCPFCLLQREYGFVGYPLYLSLLGGTIFGLGVGILSPLRKIGSLAAVVPTLQRRLALVSCLCFLALTLIAAVRMLTTDFRP